MGVCISSVRVFAGNVEIDRVDYYNQTETMLSLLQTPAKRVQEFSEGFGCAANATGAPNMTSVAINGVSDANDDNKKTVSVADLGLTIDDLQKPLPTEMAEGLQTSGVESVSRINEDSGCQWTETSGTIEATLTIPGLRGQPAGCLAVEVTETTATVTAFGQTTWSCILRGLVDPGSARARIDADGMQPVVRLALDKVESLRWGGLIKQLGEDSILR